MLDQSLSQQNERLQVVLWEVSASALEHSPTVCDGGGDVQSRRSGPAGG